MIKGAKGPVPLAHFIQKYHYMVLFSFKLGK